MVFSERFNRSLACAALVGSCLLAPAVRALQLPPTPPPGKPSTPQKLVPLPPAVQKAQSAFAHALELHKAGKAREALSAYQEFLQTAATEKLPSSALLPAYHNMAILYQQLNDLTGMATALSRLTQLEPNNATTYMQLATLYNMQRRPEEAQKAANKALSLSSKPEVAAPAHFVLGSVAAARNALPTAEKEFGISAQLAPRNAQAQFDYGLILAREKKFKQALPILEKARSLDAEMIPVALTLAAVHQQMNDVPGALAVYNALLKKQPRNLEALFNHALLLQKTGKTQEAQSAYLQTLDVAPNNLGARLNLAQLYAGSGNFAGAQKQFDIANRLHPNDARIVSGLAFSEMQQAMRQTDPVQREAGYTQAETHFKAATALEPKNFTSWNGLAFVAEQRRHTGDALEAYQKMQALAPDNPMPYLQRARLYGSLGKPEQALAVWQDFRKRKPDDTLSYMQIAGMYEAQGKLELALAEWKSYLARHPKDGAAMVAAAKELAALKRTTEAETQYKAVLEVSTNGQSANPKTRAQEAETAQEAKLNALRGLAQLAQSAEKTDAAIQWWNQFQTTDDGFAAKANRPPSVEAYQAIAQLYQQEKKPELALETYRAWAKASPKDPTPYAQLGQAQDTQKQWEAAVISYREAAKRDPTPLRYRLLVADLYRRYDKKDLAVQEYDALLSENPRDSRTLALVTDAYEQLGQDEKALKAYQTLLQADPKAEWAFAREASVLARLKRYDEARALYEKALERSPDNSQAYEELARLYGLEGKPNAYLAWLTARQETHFAERGLMEAVIEEYERQKLGNLGWANLQRLADKHPKDKAFLQVYAQTLILHNRSAEALAIYRQMAALSPNDIEAQAKLAEQLDFNNQKDDAIRIYQELIARKETTPARRVALRRQLAQIYVITGKKDEAIAQYQQVVKADPDDFLTTSTLASMLTAAGKDADAEPLYLKLLKMPTYPALAKARLRVTLGQSYEKQGRKADAITQYREALKLSPTEPDALNGLKRLGEK